MGQVLKPPMLTGNTQRDMIAQRDYLFQLAASLETIAAWGTAVQAQQTTQIVRAAAQGPDAATMAAIQNQAQELRSLIIKTANDITVYVDDKGSTYVAKSEFGEYKQTVSNSISEEHQYAESINSNLMSYQKQVEGQIIRGFIPDPDNNNERVFGIAIAQNLQVSATVVRHDEADYYEIKTNNFGLYTASGWQFWINGHKVGWFDANQEGMLHVRKVVAEDFFQVGGKWQMKIKDVGTAKGAELEFVYIGEQA